MIVWLIILWSLTAIEPFDRSDWLLENLLVFATLILLGLTYRRFTFSNASYFQLCVFLSLHLIGAHYTYAETPLGFWLQETFDLSRNHYDRIVHCAFGLLLAAPFYELLSRQSGLKHSWRYLMTITVIVALSALYELLEAITAVIVSPELGAAFLGTQGDEWDAQKDSFVATVGSIVSMLILYFYQKRNPLPN
ncbi:DUF2238 domain-containing protein [Aliikangiella coralliicola]|uniref:DUF2238 domain-containing protein n=2 Tax=Aliikangiella coralliicola TaxID=2592383 RepID=A0A545U538_9GAMM|nr:DUF2238 domain-containing protein [Aliikangiella coralliicola]